MSLRKMMVLGGLVILMQVFLAGAQEAVPGERGARPERGEEPAPRRMQERYMERVKASLEVSDEEWEALRPKIEKVRSFRMNVQRTGMGRGRREGSSEPADITPLQKTSRELREALSNKESSPKDIAAKLAALREVRKKNENELGEARKQLKELLTQKQEAHLVLMGILE